MTTLSQEVRICPMCMEEFDIDSENGLYCKYCAGTCSNCGDINTGTAWNQNPQVCKVCIDREVKAACAGDSERDKQLAWYAVHLGVPPGEVSVITRVIDEETTEAIFRCTSTNTEETAIVIVYQFIKESIDRLERLKKWRVEIEKGETRARRYAQKVLLPTSALSEAGTLQAASEAWGISWHDWGTELWKRYEHALLSEDFNKAINGNHELTVITITDPHGHTTHFCVCVDY